MKKLFIVLFFITFNNFVFAQNISSLFATKSKSSSKNLGLRTTNRQLDLVSNSKKVAFKNFIDNYKIKEFTDKSKDSTAAETQIDTIVLDPKSPTYKLDSIKQKETELKAIASKNLIKLEHEATNAKINVAKELHLKAEVLYDEKNYIEAFIILNQLAQNKDAYAEYSLGFMFDNEQGVAKNKDNAIKWYTLAANQNLIDAQNELGTIHEELFVFDLANKKKGKNLEKALFWYKKAADQNDVLALKNLVRFYSLCSDLDNNYSKNLNEIAKYYDQYLSILGSKEALYGENELEVQIQLIKIYLGNNEVKNPPKGIQLFEKIAEKSGDAAFQLGTILFNEKLSFFNRIEGLKWLKNADEMGNFDAMFMLSEIYKNGFTEIPKDKIKSDGYLSKFFENVIKDKKITEQKPEIIAKIYKEGIGTSKDYVEAINWYKKSINFPCASDNLAQIYNNGGFGIQKNPVECAKWQKKSIDFLLENSSETLKLVVADSLLSEGGAKILMDGQKNEPILFSEFKNLSLYSDSNSYLQVEDYNFIDNYNTIGIRFELGIGVKQSNFDAINWYEKSFEKTYNTYAPVNLIRLYSKAKDPEKTAFWTKNFVELLHDENNINTLTPNQFSTISVLFESGKDGFSKNLEESKFCSIKSATLTAK